MAASVAVAAARQRCIGSDGSAPEAWRRNGGGRSVSGGGGRVKRGGGAQRNGGSAIAAAWRELGIGTAAAAASAAAAA